MPPAMLRFVFIGKPHAFSLEPLRALMRRHQLVGVVESAPRDEMRRRWRPTRRQRALRRLLAWARPGALVRIAKTSRVPYLYLDARARPLLPAFLRGVRAEVVCVASLTCLLKADALAAAPRGFLNLHPSLLPRYPGPFPWFWQYHDGETRMGVTVHRIDVGEDTGAIIAQRELPIRLGAALADTMREATTLGAQLMLEAVDALERGDARERPNPSHLHAKARTVRRDERFIDWSSWPIERVWHFLQASAQWTDELRDLARLRRDEGAVAVGIERCAVDAPAGTLAHDARGPYLAHREGLIRLRVTRSRAARLGGVMAAARRLLARN